MKSTEHLLVSFTVLLLLFTGNVVAQTATAPSTGDGTPGNPYQIATLDNLYWITQNSVSWSSSFVQTADIDASSTSTWDSNQGLSPIGNSTTYFTGSYNGQAYKITGLYISRSAISNIGFFGYANGATITNVKLNNVQITGSGSVGGLIGYQYSGTATSCHSSGSVTGTNLVGGLIGAQYWHGTATNCYSSGSATATTGAYVGGLIGGQRYYAALTNCYSSDAVTGANVYAGGLIGYQDNSSSATKCYSSGSVTDPSANVGGLIGYQSASAATNCFWDTQTSGQTSSAGGTGKSTANMKTQSTFTNAGWSFGTVWAISGLVNNGYPFLLGVTPTSFPMNNLSLWLRADAGVMSSGGAIFQWADQSGNGNDATQGTSSNMPVAGSSINGQPTISFNRTYPYYLALPSASTLGIVSDPYEIFIVARSSDATDIQFLLGGSPKGNYELHLNNSSGVRFFPIPGSSSYLDAGTAGQYTDGNAHVFSARASSSGGAVRVDGVDGGTSSTDITSSATDYLNLGLCSDGTSPFNGDIAEVLLYKNIMLDLTQRDSVEHYLANRYGITSGALPVELTSFVASVSNLTTVLAWKTATEVNNAGFDIERRQVSAQQWIRIGSVTGAGISNGPHDYSYTDNVGTAGTYSYRLKQIDHDGAFRYSLEVEVAVGVAPKVFELSQNFPNPFNPTTNIQFTVPVDGRAVLKIFNTLGQEVATLFNDEAAAGKYNQVQFNASNLAAGIYFSRLEFGGNQLVKKMVLIK